MRKVSAVGLVIGVLFLVVVFGIASIPDEVLESNSIEKSDGPIITVPKAPQIAELETPQVAELETPQVAEPETPQVAEPETPQVAEPETPQVAEPETPEVAEPETPEVAEPETNSEESEGKIIRVEISDGVGTTLR